MCVLLQVPFLLKYNIIPGPVPNSIGALVFVSMRLSTWPKDKVCDLPKHVAAKFEHTFATTAQQFRGYLFAMDSSSFARVGTQKGSIHTHCSWCCSPAGIPRVSCLCAHTLGCVPTVYNTVVHKLCMSYQLCVFDS